MGIAWARKRRKMRLSVGAKLRSSGRSRSRAKRMTKATVACVCEAHATVTGCCCAKRTWGASSAKWAKSRDPLFRYPKPQVAEIVSSSESVDLSNSSLMVLSLPMNILSTHSSNIAVPDIPKDSTFSNSTVLAPVLQEESNTAIDATDR
ncbi:hypothetical protein RND71_016961 [Anisodus tanguticus]|uniref:Uncharacterized protein n=1 Tax=Anisodus tanguticus TaxID=243964 RepID=A0AAE1VIP1_9SOLA|nr:hypothetical protein RND71_016961 [Anisodus tanguticus]